MRQKPVQPTSTTNNSDHHERAMQKRVAVTIGIVILLFTICWTPYFVYTLTNNEDAYINMKYSWIRTFYLSNSSMNFIVYSLRIYHFRVAYRKIIKRILPKRVSEMRGISGATITSKNTPNCLERSQGPSNNMDLTMKSGRQDEIDHNKVSTLEVSNL